METVESNKQDSLVLDNFSLKEKLDSFDSLDLTQQLELLATASRIPDLQANVAARLVPKFLYNLNYSESDGTEFANFIAKTDPTWQIELLYSLKTVALDAAANGTWARPALEKITKIARALAGTEKCVLVKIFVEDLLNQFEQERNEPTGSFIKLSDDKSNGRSVDNRVVSDPALMRGCVLSEVLGRDENLVRLSTDVIGVADQSGLVHKIGYLQTESALGSTGLPRPNDVQKLTDYLQKDNEVLITKAVEFFLDKIYSQLNQANREQFLDTGLNVLTKDFCQELSTLKSEIDAINNDLQQEESKFFIEAEEKNELASQQFVEKVLDLTKNVSDLSDFQKKQRDIILKNRISDSEVAFTSASMLGRHFDVDQESDLGRQLKNAVDSVQTAHQKNFAEAEERFHFLQSEFQTKHASILEKYGLLLARIKEKKTVCLAEMQKMLEKITEYLEINLPKVVLKPVAELTTDVSVRPFGSMVANEADTFLIQQLQTPVVRNSVEKELGFDLAKISLRSQLILLEFLLEKDDHTFETTKAILAREDLNSLDFVKTFLAGSVDKKILNQFVEFARSSPVELVNKVTEIYANITDLIDGVEGRVREYFGVTKKIDTRKVVQEIVKRANQVLVGVIARPDETALTRLDAVKHDVIGLAALFKTARSEIKDFTEIVGLDYQTVGGDALTSEQKRQIVELSRLNYETVQPEVVDRLEKFLEDRTQVAQNTFVLLSQNLTNESRLLACLRVESRGPDRVYMGAFNVRAEAHGAGIGERMLEKEINDLKKTKTIEAIMVAELQAGTHYIEKMGAVATWFESYNGGSNSLGHYDIVVEKDPLPSMLAGLPKEALLRMYAADFKNKDPFTKIGEPIILAEFDTTTQMDAVAKLSEVLLNEQNYRLTRYVSLDPAGIKRLYGFEQVSTEPVAT